MKCGLGSIGRCLPKSIMGRFAARQKDGHGERTPNRDQVCHVDERVDAGDVACLCSRRRSTWAATRCCVGFARKAEKAPRHASIEGIPAIGVSSSSPWPPAALPECLEEFGGTGAVVQTGGTDHAAADGGKTLGESRIAGEQRIQRSATARRAAKPNRSVPKTRCSQVRTRGAARTRSRKTDPACA